MDKISLISTEKDNISNWAVDGLLYGLAGGTAMILILAALSLLSSNSPGNLLASFSAGDMTSPIQGLLSHLAVSSIYGVLFGTLAWPLLRRFSSAKLAGWLGGLSYAVMLLILAQLAILPGIKSPLVLLPAWESAIGHLTYGLVLGALFGRKQNQ